MEYAAQCDVVQWLREHPQRPLFFATNNGVHCHVATRVKQIKAGMAKGVPDVVVCEPRAPHHGLFIEMKAAGGRLRPEQRVWLADLQARGYQTAVCHSAEQAIAVISKYLE